MKKNRMWILVGVIIAVLFGVGVYFYITTTNNNNNEQNYEGQKTSTINNNAENSNIAENSNNTENKTSEEQKIQEEENKQKEAETEKQKQQAQAEQQYTEEQLSTFSTKIYSKDSARQNNIKITCNTLNDTTVKNGATFSFCSTVGKATSAKGYQEADVYDHNGNKTKGLRGWKLSSK